MNQANIKKPKLISFDLDYTLWPFWMDTNVTPPFSKNGKGQVVDVKNRTLEIYPEVHDILTYLKGEGYVLAVVSRPETPEIATKLLQFFELDKYFTHKEIYPGSKITHFTRIKKNSGIDYSAMVHFDDEPRNKRDLDTLGIYTILVIGEIKKELVKNGLREYTNK